MGAPTRTAELYCLFFDDSKIRNHYVYLRKTLLCILELKVVSFTGFMKYVK